MKLQFNMKFFYVGGAVCFSIVALMNALSLFLNPQTLISAISAVAYLIFECLLVYGFVYERMFLIFIISKEFCGT